MAITHSEKKKWKNKISWRYIHANVAWVQRA